LLKLKGALKKGTKVSMTLEFEKAGRVDVAFEVLGPAAKGPVAPKASAPADDGKMKK
jgi:copper(I)-binding protein